MGSFRGMSLLAGQPSSSRSMVRCAVSAAVLRFALPMGSGALQALAKWPSVDALVARRRALVAARVAAPSHVPLSDPQSL